MKWVFAILVALNLIVFSAMVAVKVTGKNTQSRESAAQVSESSGNRSVAGMFDMQDETANRNQEDLAWVQENQVNIPQHVPASAVAEKKPKAAAPKNTDKEKAANTADTGINDNAGFQRSCTTTTASITMPEDDYHRIKGMLNKWPHAASRMVGKRSTPAANATYSVWLPSGNDVSAQMQALAAKGFTPVLADGGISVGTSTSSMGAQNLLNRLRNAGFSGLIRESGGGGSLSESKMQVVFMTVNEQDTRAIQDIVGRYGTLRVNKCR